MLLKIRCYFILKIVLTFRIIIKAIRIMQHLTKKIEPKHLLRSETNYFSPQIYSHAFS